MIFLTKNSFKIVPRFITIVGLAAIVLSGAAGHKDEHPIKRYKTLGHEALIVLMDYPIK